MQATTADTVSAVANVVTAVAAVLTMIAAIKAIDAWKKELVGGDEYELAKNLLTLVYRLRLAANKFRASCSSKSGIQFDKKESVEELSRLWPEFEAAISTARGLWGDVKTFSGEKGFHAYFGEFFTPPIHGYLLPDYEDKKHDAEVKRVIENFRTYLAPHLNKSTNYGFDEF